MGVRLSFMKDTINHVPKVVLILSLSISWKEDPLVV